MFYISTNRSETRARQLSHFVWFKDINYIFLKTNISLKIIFFIEKMAIWAWNGVTYMLDTLLVASHLGKFITIKLT
jgi:hypothetical protein